MYVPRSVTGVTVLGVGRHPITVEAFVGRGLPTIVMTGLPGAAVQDGPPDPGGYVATRLSRTT
jgi:hypothetical protein